MSTEQVDDALHARVIELRKQNPAACLGCAFLAWCDESQEQLPRRLAVCVFKARIDRVGAAADGTAQAAEVMESVERQGVADPSLEQLGQRVLQQRQGGLVADVAHDLGDQPGLDLDADVARGADDRRLDVGCRHRSHRLRGLRQQIAERPVEKGAVEEVRPQRQDDADARTDVGDCRANAVQKPNTGFVVVDVREHLFELVDHDQEL